MKIRLTYLIPLLLLYFTNKCIAQTVAVGYRHSELNIPFSPGIPASFYVNDAKRIFLPLNGGIYLPKDSLWFIPPSDGYYFTSYTPVMKDTALFVFANRSDSSELFYLKNSLKASIKRYSILKIKKGIYNLIYKDDVCYVWGYDSRDSKIGILGGNSIKWFFSVKGFIRQVHITKSNEIYFCLDSSIYSLTNHKIVTKLNEKILGFDIDLNNRIILACNEGIGIQDGDKVKMIALGITGLIEIDKDTIYVLSLDGKKIYSVSLVPN